MWVAGTVKGNCLFYSRNFPLLARCLSGPVDSTGPTVQAFPVGRRINTWLSDYLGVLAFHEKGFS